MDISITTIIIILLIIGAGGAGLIWAALLIDLRRFKSYRAKRDEQANAAWWKAREEKDGE